MPEPEFICAGPGLDNKPCQKTGKFSCKNCFLVLYCGPVCQKSHWPSHKIDCKSNLGKETWLPNWLLENRTPAFFGDPVPVQCIPHVNYFWGNTPAFDILRFETHEGADYEGPINLLYAASGDPRNVIKTIAEIPSSYDRTVNVTLNDNNLDVVIRNAIMLLVALVVEDRDEAIDCIMHVWYSSFIRNSHLQILHQRMRPLVDDVCGKIINNNPGRVLVSTWTFNRYSLRLVLTAPAWKRLRSLMDVPSGLDVEKARKVRRAVTLGGTSKCQDNRDHVLLRQSRPHRIARNRFWEDGLLLPFGSRRDDFVVPNPTLFQDPGVWTVKVLADPLDGWLPRDVAATSSGPATADIYGKLFRHVRGVLESFLDRLSCLEVNFRLLQVDATQLKVHPELVQDQESFNRIDVSNICDRRWAGPLSTVDAMLPLLQAQKVNPHATLITLFMNGIRESMTSEERIAECYKTMTTRSGVDIRAWYIPGEPYSPELNDPLKIKRSFAWDLIISIDAFNRAFDRYVKDSEFHRLNHEGGIMMKDEHTIIEKHPFRLKLSPGQPGAQKEFDQVLASPLMGMERYVEWKRR